MIKIENLSYHVGEKVILNNVNIDFVKGKIYAITGHNGSGKSTLVKIIMGLIKQTEGNIFLNEENINDLSVCERSKKSMGFTFQQPIKFKGLTVLDMMQNVSQEKPMLAYCCKYLSKVGLCAKDYLHRELDGTLSGGELKRIELAINLAENKKINIFDEPEAGIDIWSFKGLTEIFKNLKSPDSITIIVTHQQKILDIADEIIILNSGEVEKKGNSKDILPFLKNSSCLKLNGVDNG